MLCRHKRACLYTPGGLGWRHCLAVLRKPSTGPPELLWLSVGRVQRWGSSWVSPHGCARTQPQVGFELYFPRVCVGDMIRSQRHMGPITEPALRAVRLCSTLARALLLPWLSLQLWCYIADDVSCASATCAVAGLADLWHNNVNSVPEVDSKAILFSAKKIQG